MPMLEIMVLANLLLGQSHAYKLKNDLKILNPNNNTIYPLLNKLEEKGYVEGKRELQESRPYKTTYHITEEGKAHFIDLLCDFDVREAFNNDAFYIRVAFFQLLDINDIAKIIRTRERALNNFAHAQEILDEMNDTEPPEELVMLQDYMQKREAKEFQFLDMLRKKYNLK